MMGNATTIETFSFIEGKEIQCLITFVFVLGCAYKMSILSFVFSLLSPFRRISLRGIICFSAKFSFYVIQFQHHIVTIIRKQKGFVCHITVLVFFMHQIVQTGITCTDGIKGFLFFMDQGNCYSWEKRRKNFSTVYLKWYI